jgi:probable LLM family oxidoreductase
MTTTAMELGVYSFGDATVDSTGYEVTHAERIARLVEEVEAADRAGLDVYAIGEHHRPDYAVSAPAVVLAAGAARTERIRLSSAVTVLSSDDPIRVFQQYATLDAISGGRAEIMAGRGSFVESFGLFGHDLADYDTLFAEKLELLLRLCREVPVTWPGGRHTHALEDVTAYPRPVQWPLPLWIAVGGTPQSVVRAAVLGIPLAIAIIGGDPAQFAPFVELYRAAAKEAGHDPDQLGVAISVHGFVADTDEEAQRIAFGPYHRTFNRIARERGFAPVNKATFDAGVAPDGHLLVGGPETVAAKLGAWRELFGHSRTLVQLSTATTPHDEVLHAIDLLGREVAPRLAQ